MTSQNSSNFMIPDNKYYLCNYDWAVIFISVYKLWMSKVKKVTDKKWPFWISLVVQTKTFPENWDSKAPSVGTLLAYLFRDYSLIYIFFRNKTFFFQDRKLKLSGSVWNWISWNLAKCQLNQTTDKKDENNNYLNKLNELKFCEVFRILISNWT